MTPHDDIEVTPQDDTRATTSVDTKATTTGDLEVTPLTYTKVTTPASTELSIHTNKGFLGGSRSRFMLARYVNHVALRLWKGELSVCVCVNVCVIFNLFYLLLIR